MGRKAPKLAENKSGVEKLTRSSLQGLSNRALFAYKHYSPLRYRIFISLKRGKFVFEKSLSETPFKPDRFSFCTPKQGARLKSARLSFVGTQRSQHTHRFPERTQEWAKTNLDSRNPDCTGTRGPTRQIMQGLTFFGSLGAAHKNGMHAIFLQLEALRMTKTT